MEYGVSEETSKALAEKLRNVIALDSMILDETDAVRTSEIPTLTGYNTIYHFADGSILVSSAEVYDKLVAASKMRGTGITGGTISSGTGYTNGKNRTVYYENPGVCKISFKADYGLVNGGFDSISKAYNHSVCGWSWGK